MPSSITLPGNHLKLQNHRDRSSILSYDGQDDEEDNADSKNSSGLTFVIKTDHPSLRTSEEKLLVRSHAMHAFLRDKKINADNAATDKQPRFTGNVQDGQGRFKLNTWSRKKPVTAPRDKSQNDGKAKKKIYQKKKIPGTREYLVGNTTVSGMPHGDAVQGPLEVSARLEPFNMLPIPANSYSQKLFHHYNTSFTLNSVVINHEGTWISFAMTNAAVFHATMSLVSLHYGLIGGKLESFNSLHHKVEAIRTLNTMMKDVATRMSDESIGAVALLLNFESVNGTFDNALVHMTGLEQLVSMRGGLQAFEHNRVLLRVLIWCDISYACTWDQPPRFSLPPSTDPSNSRLAKFSSMSDPSSTAIPFTDPSWCISRPSMLTILETLRRVTYAIAMPNPLSGLTNQDRKALSDAVNKLEYDLLLLRNISTPSPEAQYTYPLVEASSYFDLGVRYFSPTSLSPPYTPFDEDLNDGYKYASLALTPPPQTLLNLDLTEPFRLASLLYTHVIIREIPFTARMHRPLMQKLYDDLHHLRLQSSTLFEDIETDTLLLVHWMLFIGMAVASDSEFQQAFSSLLRDSGFALAMHLGEIGGELGYGVGGEGYTDSEFWHGKEWMEAMLTRILWAPNMSICCLVLDRVWKTLKVLS